jgi:hypothetical protein
MKPVDNRVGTGRHQVTDGKSRCPISGVLPERPRIQYGYRGTCYHGLTPCDTPSVREVADSFGRGQQAARVTELKCLHRSPKGDRAARKGISGLLPGVESWSSEVRVSDGMLKPNPEDSSHYCLLLGDGDINNRGEGDEAFNTRVCRPRGVIGVDSRAITESE